MKMKVRGAHRWRRIAPTLVLSALALVSFWATLTTPHARAQQASATPIAVVVELAESSVVEHLTALEASGGLNRMAYRQAAQAQLARVNASQAAMASHLRTFGAAEIYRVQRVYNGIAVRVDPARLDELLAMPDVKAIHPIIAKYPTHATSVPAIGAPALWSGLNGNLSGATGAGIRIAVIDTGIDYLHRDFGGPGSGYDSNDVTIGGDVPGFPSAKVVGGYDFTGDAYNADPNDDSYQPFPNPDPDPYDCYAHGTHVAGTAAGYGVDRDGLTYRGPYAEALDLDEMIIAPGVAPEAQLYALKVFGCSGATELTDLAIEWAVDPNGDGDLSDRVDVINLSLGSAYGTRMDTTALAADRAAAAGVVVVASAGNSGSSYFVTGSPGVADQAISVAAVELIAAPGGVTPAMASFSSRGPRAGDGVLKPDVAAPGRAIRSARAGTSTGAMTLSGTSMAAPHVAGATALLRQLNPTLSVAELKALVMTTASERVEESDAGWAGPTRAGAGMLDVHAAAASPLLAYAAEEPGRVSLSFGSVDVHEAVTLTRQVRVVNRGDEPVEVTPQLDSLVELPGAEFTLAASAPVTLAAGSSYDFPVRLTIDAAALRHTHFTAGSPQLGSSQWLSEITGMMRFSARTAAGELLPALHIPIHAAPRPIADLAATSPLAVSAELTATLVISGQPLVGSEPPTDVLSLISLFELSHISAKKPVEENPANGIKEYADLSYIGVNSEIGKDQSGANDMLFFGVAMHGAWSSPNQVEVAVWFDIDGDGQDDYRLFNGNSEGYSDDRGYSDTFLAVVEDMKTGVRWPGVPLNLHPADELETRPFGSSVMVLPVRAGQIGLGSGDRTFTYRVTTHIDGDPMPYDASPRLVYSRTKPGFTPAMDGPTPILLPVDGEWALPLTISAENLGRNRSRGLLLFSHHNDVDVQSEAIALDLDLPPRIFLPLTAGE